jgi:hypothetical protein
VPRTQRSAISAFTRVFDALWPLRSGALQSRAVTNTNLVMPGRVPGIHVFRSDTKQEVDGRDKPGHDGTGVCYGPGSAERHEECRTASGTRKKGPRSKPEPHVCNHA